MSVCEGTQQVRSGFNLRTHTRERRHPTCVDSRLRVCRTVLNKRRQNFCVKHVSHKCCVERRATQCFVVCMFVCQSTFWAVRGKDTSIKVHALQEDGGVRIVHVVYVDIWHNRGRISPFAKNALRSIANRDCFRHPTSILTMWSCDGGLPSEMHDTKLT